ncbi:MAG TPA: DUF4136 domain-containing protein [Burkholderiales bacterium]|jgi:hypothetical protein|nr:DUF4136 domain-containing protein [Burkholderiales bacterium]
MSRSALRICLCLIALPLAGCAAKSLQPTTMALKYQSTEDPSATPLVQPCAALSALKIEDARRGGEPGKRWLERQPAMEQPISLSGDPLPWFRQAVDLHLRRAGLLTNAAGKPAGHMRLEQISMSEQVYLRASYNGRVTLSLDLISAASGRTCWSARVTGFAENRGYPGSTENYNETLNQALDKALIQLLGSAELSANLCGKC